nr:hypothetical protein [Tanacetum cinerariifolium]
PALRRRVSAFLPSCGQHRVPPAAHRALARCAQLRARPPAQLAWPGTAAVLAR